ncbi:MAG TPA: hypothetical protein VLS25_05315, partial [Dehalococcoidia bacterium]|nr:hypothetical protein [Dehalococcoidia bacterium]
MLYANEWSTPVAIAFAADHPRQVSHLILYGGFGRASDLAQRDRFKALIDLCRTNWKMASEVVADVAHPSREGDADVSRRLAQIFRDSISGEAMAEWFREG